MSAPRRALVLALALGACARTSITLAPGAQTVPGAADVGVQQVAGVRVTVQADAWPGDRRVAEVVHAVRVTIANGSGMTLRVKYGDFALVSAGGRRYAALPPVKVEGELLSPLLADGYAPILAPGFVHRGFYLAPYFGRLYPGLPVWRSRYAFYDPWYYGAYYPSLARAMRPTVEMLGLALPEGVLEPGGQVGGFVYFQQVAPGTASVTLHAALVAVADSAGAASHAMLGDVAIPFSVITRR